MLRLSIPRACLAVTIGLLAPWAHANDALAAKYSCVACHAKEQKLVGPAFKAIASKYAGDAKAVDKLATKVKTGGAGVWGSVPMPPNAQVPDGDVKALVGWILKMK